MSNAELGTLGGNGGHASGPYLHVWEGGVGGFLHCAICHENARLWAVYYTTKDEPGYMRAEYIFAPSSAVAIERFWDTLDDAEGVTVADVRHSA